MLCIPTPNGFADPYPVLKNGYFVGGLDPIFRLPQLRPAERFGTHGSLQRFGAAGHNLDRCSWHRLSIYIYILCLVYV